MLEVEVHHIREPHEFVRGESQSNLRVDLFKILAAL